MRNGVILVVVAAALFMLGMGASRFLQPSQPASAASTPRPQAARTDALQWERAFRATHRSEGDRLVDGWTEYSACFADPRPGPCASPMRIARRPSTDDYEIALQRATDPVRPTARLLVSPCTSPSVVVAGFRAGAAGTSLDRSSVSAKDSGGVLFDTALSVRPAMQFGAHAQVSTADEGTLVLDQNRQDKLMGSAGEVTLWLNGISPTATQVKESPAIVADVRALIAVGKMIAASTRAEDRVGCPK